MEQQDGTNSQTPEEQTVSPEPATPTKRQLTRNEKIRDFAIGFIGWWVVNGIFWANNSPQDTESLYILTACFVLPLNFLVLIILAFLRRWMALGVLATYVVNFAIAAILGTTTNGICWIPFTSLVE